MLRRTSFQQDHHQCSEWVEMISIQTMFCFIINNIVPVLFLCIYIYIHSYIFIFIFIFIYTFIRVQPGGDCSRGAGVQFFSQWQRRARQTTCIYSVAAARLSREGRARRHHHCYTNAMLPAVVRKKKTKTSTRRDKRSQQVTVHWVSAPPTSESRAPHAR